MSERINVDHAFDPEARKAQAELDAYIDSRPLEDHGADDSHYEATLNEGDYSSESLEQLAQRVAEARAQGDKTRAGDAEEAFFNKFAEYSDKYGWEEEVVDDSATGQLAVNKDAKLGRDTIDVRLERYSKIMYGADVSEERVEEARHEVEAAIEAAETADEVNTEAAAMEEEAAETDESVEAEPTPEETASEAPSIDDEIEAAKARLHADADARAAQAIDAINGTDQAKADRELLEPVSLDGLEPADADNDDELEPVSLDGLEPVDEPNETPALEGESIEEYEARNGVEAESDETAELEAQADEDGYVKPSRWQRIRRWMTPSGASANFAALSHTQRERLKERKHGRAAMIVGGLAVAGAGVAGYLLLKNGGHDGGNGGVGNWFNDLFDGNDTNPTNPVEPTTPTEPVEPPRGGNGLNWNDFDPSARNVTDGEGWYSTFQQMGIPEDNWSDILKDAGPKLGELGDAYYDDSAKEWRISNPGRLSGESLRVIAAAAKRDGVDLGA